MGSSAIHLDKVILYILFQTDIGLPVLRAFGSTDQFFSRFVELQNNNTRMWLTFLTSARWFGFRIDTLSALFMTIVAFLSVALRDALSLPPGLIGLMLSYCLQLVRPFIKLPFDYSFDDFLQF